MRASHLASRWRPSLMPPREISTRPSEAAACWRWPERAAWARSPCSRTVGSLRS